MEVQRKPLRCGVVRVVVRARGLGPVLGLVAGLAVAVVEC